LSGSLHARVHDLAHGITELLVPFFLANIGLHLQLSVFSSHSTLLLAILIVPVAIFSKLLGCGLGASRFGRIIATRVGLGMIPRGEFCMVVAQAGLSMKAISPATYAVVVFMAVVATLLAPPLLKLAFRGVLVPPGEQQEVFHIG
jgi:Kef-type K+ transport system membrane component KefB